MAVGCRSVGRILLQHEVEVGATEPERAQPAMRLRPAGTSQSRSWVFTANGDWLQSTLGLACSKVILGGSTFSCNASVALRRPAAPAADLRCPMLDLTEPSATDPRGRCAPLRLGQRG